LGPEEASGVASGVAEAGCIGSYESLDDGDGKETAATAGLKTTGLEPEQLSCFNNRAEGAISDWQDANPSTELQLGRQLSARRQIPIHAVFNCLRMEKEFNGLTDGRLAELFYQGLSHKKPILPSTDSILETRVQGTYKVPEIISRKGTGEKRGSYQKKTADKELLKRHARTTTANGGESISESFIQETLPRFKEKNMFVSQPNAEIKDGKAERNTEKNPEGEKKVMSGLSALSDSSRAQRLTPRFLNINAKAAKRRKTTKDREEEQRKKKAEDQRKKKAKEQRKKRAEEQRKEKEDSGDDDNYDGIDFVPV
jgi:hypothetical protein